MLMHLLAAAGLAICAGTFAPICLGKFKKGWTLIAASYGAAGHSGVIYPQGTVHLDAGAAHEVSGTAEHASQMPLSDLFGKLRVNGKGSCYLLVDTRASADDHAAITIEAYNHSNNEFDRHVLPKLAGLKIAYHVQKHEKGDRHRTISLSVSRAVLGNVHAALNTIK